MARTSQSALANVQNLYLMQIELWNFLDEPAPDASTKKEVQQKLKEFESLLNAADPAYMGDEEVLKELQKIPGEVRAKLKGTKSAPKKKATKKISAKKTVVTKAKKPVVTKKKASKKK